MGQCYAFGTTIRAGCGHAMVVAPEGGACVCATCRARCEGRFAGCARILAQPGFVPVDAPRWAVERTVPPRAARSEQPRGGSDDDSQAEAVRDRITELRAALLHTLGETEQRLRHHIATEVGQRTRAEHGALREEIISQMDAVRRGIAGSQKEIGEFYERLVDAYDRLLEEQQAHRATMHAFVEGFDRLLQRVQSIEQRL